MKYLKILFFLFFLLCFLTNYSRARGVNGGMSCAACTIMSGLVQQDAYIKGISLFEAAKLYCKKLPRKVQSSCYSVVNSLEPFFTDKRVLEIFTPDVFCFAIRSCRVDPGEKFCHLFPEPHVAFTRAQKQMEKVMLMHDVNHKLQGLHQRETHDSTYSNLVVSPLSDYLVNLNLDISHKNKPLKSVDFCLMPILKEICEILSGTFKHLKPVQDFDGDGHSMIKSARGADWKGRDCDDLDLNVYPGAQPFRLDSRFDGNCNGIYGVDPESGRPWEEILCSETQPQGLIYLGDSVGAHFHFPESWINPTIPNKSNVVTRMDTLLDELDWPELGYATGYKNTSHPDIINGSTDSIYLRMRARNLCNHRDYQNIARNGAASNETMEEIDVISRNPSDKPVILMYAMLGNDVCNRLRDTINNMTPPSVFKKYVIKGLNVLEKKLPLNSHVVLMSLIDASFIYPAMADRVHPLGSLFGNILYKDMYSWFSCMEIGPCEGWMTLNATLREITTQKSIELSEVLNSIAKESKYESFKVHYIENPLKKVIDSWVSEGHHIYELIDSVDSTHPNQLVQPKLADAIWKSLEELNILGPVNPHNNKIRQLFGDQGGH